MKILQNRSHLRIVRQTIYLSPLLHTHIQIDWSTVVIVSIASSIVTLRNSASFLYFFTFRSKICTCGPIPWNSCEICSKRSSWRRTSGSFIDASTSQKHTVKSNGECPWCADPRLEGTCRSSFDNWPTARAASWAVWLSRRLCFQSSWIPPSAAFCEMKEGRA